MFDCTAVIYSLSLFVLFRTKFPVTYNIYNRTPYTQEIEINMEASEAFMFSGHKQVCMQVMMERLCRSHACSLVI